MATFILMLDFNELFIGSERSHGLWDAERGATTVREPAGPADYANHLSGIVGLGLVPVRQNGTCRFGAIDVDVDNIDHAALLAKVLERRIPLNVCRSKSGGAHLYAFAAEPGWPAERLRDALRKWSALLGYPAAEIFPKQAKITSRNLGNWINLPYFANERTTRYALGPAGALSLHDFLTGVLFLTDEAVAAVDEGPPAFDETQMPPCLRTLRQNGLPEGGRNQGLFNFGVFFRKSCPNSWEDKLVQLNQAVLTPPLAYRELKTVISSVGRVKYQYTCSQSPIREHCDREACVKLPFGVGHMPWNEKGTYDDMLISRLRKLLTDPPRYVIEVNGHDVELSSEEFISFGRFRIRLLELLDLVIEPMKQPSWESTIKTLLQQKEDIAAPEEASLAGQLMERVMEFLSHRDRARSLEDLLRGLPVTEDDRVLFRVTDFQRFLLAHRVEGRVETAQLYQLLRARGATHVRIWVLGQRVNVWSYPLSGVNEQKENFTPAIDNDQGEELL